MGVSSALVSLGLSGAAAHSTITVLLADFARALAGAVGAALGAFLCFRRCGAQISDGCYMYAVMIVATQR